jgi:hypothetical protein
MLCYAVPNGMERGLFLLIDQAKSPTTCVFFIYIDQCSGMGSILSSHDQYIYRALARLGAPLCVLETLTTWDCTDCLYVPHSSHAISIVREPNRTWRKP